MFSSLSDAFPTTPAVTASHRRAAVDRARVLAILAVIVIHCNPFIYPLFHSPAEQFIEIVLARLARFGLSRSDLRQPSEARDAAIKAQLADLLASWQDADGLQGPLSVFRALESRHDVSLARRAAGAGDALEVLQRDLPRSGLKETFAAWRAARAWRLAV